MRWTAHYTDGTCLEQFDGETERSYRDIDQSRLSHFTVSEGGRIVLTEHVEPGSRLIFIKRHFQRGNGPEDLETIWIIGSQRTVRDVNVQHVSYIAADGHVEVMERFRDPHAVTRSPDPELYGSWEP